MLTNQPLEDRGLREIAGNAAKDIYEDVMMELSNISSISQTILSAIREATKQQAKRIEELQEVLSGFTENQEPTENRPEEEGD